MPSSASTASTSATGCRGPGARAGGRTLRRRTAGRAGGAGRAGKRRDRRGDAGICVSRPAPSPELSVEAAPRWATRATASSAIATTSWERTPEAGPRSRRRRRRAHGWRPVLPMAASRRVGDRDDGNRPDGSAAQWRPWYLLLVAPLAAGETDAGQQKSPLLVGAGRGSCAMLLAYPVAPEEPDDIETDDDRGKLAWRSWPYYYARRMNESRRVRTPFDMSPRRSG